MENDYSNSLHEFLFRRMDGMIALKKGLDAFALRQKVISANIANSETPNYNAGRVTFEEELAKILDRRSSGLQRTNSRHIPVRSGLRALDNLHAKVIADDSPSNYNGVNNVDIDKEMGLLATNQIQYATGSKLLTVRYRVLISAIRGR